MSAKKQFRTPGWLQREMLKAIREEQPRVVNHKPFDPDVAIMAPEIEEARDVFIYHGVLRDLLQTVPYFYREQASGNLISIVVRTEDITRAISLLS